MSYFFYSPERFLLSFRPSQVMVAYRLYQDFSCDRLSIVIPKKRSAGLDLAELSAGAGHHDAYSYGLHSYGLHSYGRRRYSQRTSCSQTLGRMALFAYEFITYRWQQRISVGVPGDCRRHEQTEEWIDGEARTHGRSACTHACTSIPEAMTM